MKYTIFILLASIVICVKAQETVVFKFGDSVTEKDRVVFLAKNKYNMNDFYSEEKINIIKDEENDTYQLKISKPTVILIALFPEINIFQEVYLTTNDTITINKEFNNDTFFLSLVGIDKCNYAQYNFSATEAAWQKENPAPFYQLGNPLAKHKESVKEWINKKNLFFQSYLKKHNALKGFSLFMDSRIVCEYTFHLLSPLFQGIINYPDDYMDGEIVGDYNSRPFVVASNLYIRWFREVQNNNLQQISQYLEAHFSGDTKEYLVSLMLGLYVDGQNVDSGEYLNLANNYEGNFENMTYIEYIRNAKAFFLKSFSVIPDSISTITRLESIDSKEIDLKTVLENAKGSYVIFDFWASWCGPCIKDIKLSAKMKELFSQNGIIYIYLSLDESAEAWKTSYEELGIKDGQYRILDVKNSPLIRYLKINSIPRYIFLNKDLLIMNLHGPAPLIGRKEYFQHVFGWN